MLTGFLCLVKFLGQAKVNHVNMMTLFLNSHKKIVWFDVPVDDAIGVNVFDAGEHLHAKHQHGLETELPTTIAEIVFQGGPK